MIESMDVKRIIKQKCDLLSLAITVGYMMMSLLFASSYIRHEYHKVVTEWYASMCISRINVMVQIITYFMAFFCASFVVYFVIHAIRNLCGWEKKEIFQLVGWALPILICLIKAFVDYGNAVGFDTAYYNGDEYNIWLAAIVGYPFSFIYTSFVFLVSIFIFPFRYGPIICKLFVTLFVALYIVINTAKRTNRTFLVVWEYILFLGGVYIDQSVNTHRMFWYALLYVFICAEMFFLWYDTECGESYSDDFIINKIVVTIAGFALLSVWRREGIYLVIFAGVYWLIYIRKFSDLFISSKAVTRRMICIFITSLIVFWTPTIIFESKVNNLDDGGIVYDASIIWMIKEPTFDYSKSQDDLEQINRVMSIEAINRLVEAVGDDVYASCSYVYPSYEYCVMRDDYGPEDSQLFEKSVVNIIKKQPLVYLRSRVNAFMAVAKVRNEYNLIVPLILTVVLVFGGLIKKNLLVSLMSAGVLTHVVLTVLFMPANFFKYFYELYLYGYIFMILSLIEPHSKTRSTDELFLGKHKVALSKNMSLIK